MTAERVDLFAHSRNVFSQHGEDGIFEKIFEIENVTKGYFIEFGAWDGKHFSNAYNLYQKGWTGCYIEGDARKHRELVANIPDPNVAKINAWVSSEGPTSLDSIVTRLNPPQIDLLSIDIDGDDLRVWKGFRVARPLIVVIEYNPTIPPDVRYENPPGANHGNASRSITEFATANGYALLDGTTSNLIFARHGARVLDIARTKTLAEIVDQTPPTRYFFGYDGTLITSSTASRRHVNDLIPIPWTAPRCFFPQPLPRSLRSFSPSPLVATLKFVYRTLLAVVFHPIASARLLSAYFERRR